MRSLAVTLLLLLGACAAPRIEASQPGPAGPPDGPARQQTHMIPAPQPDGTQAMLLGRVCRPVGERPARVVVIAHGSPPLASARPGMQLTSCESEAVRWFLDRGYLVALSLRRGYGGTGGAYAETSGDCSVDAYERAARESARDVAATVAYALSLPQARRDGAIVVGQSAGGWAAMGLDSVPHPGVAALVSMAGGRGGHSGNRPHNNCRPENLAAAAGRLGRTATTPMLWVYTANDTYFSPTIAAALHRAFTEAGGKARIVALPGFEEDGHRLFFGRGGSAVWGPLVERYLAEQGAI